MISTLRVRGFRSLIDTQPLRLEDLCVFIGPNGSGKSSLMQAVHMLRAFCRSSIELHLLDVGLTYEEICNANHRHLPPQWSLTALLPPDEQGRGGGSYRYEVTLSRPKLGIRTESLAYHPGDGQWQDLIRTTKQGLRLVWDHKTARYRDMGRIASSCSVLALLDRGDTQGQPEALRFRSWLDGIRCHESMDLGALRAGHLGECRELGSRGEGLPGVLAALEKTEPKAWSALTRWITECAPQYEGIAVSGARGAKGWKEVVALRGGRALSSHQMSDGFLRLLGLLTAAAQPYGESVLIHEEPENGMHPHLLRELVGILRSLTLRKPPHQRQVLLTTHSPALLDEFYDSPEQVYVIEDQGPAEGTYIERLSEKQDIDLVRELFGKSLGQAWFTGSLGGVPGRRLP